MYASAGSAALDAAKCSRRAACFRTADDTHHLAELMKRILDDHSGSGAASRPAAAPAAAQRPGAHRPANPGAFPVDAAPEALRGLGRAPRPAGDAAPGPSGSGRQVRLRTTGRIEDLPQAARQQASAQVLRWAERLEPGPALKRMEPLQALPEAAREPAFSGLLQGGSSVAPAQRTERLKALAAASRCLSGPGHVQAVREVVAASRSLAPEQRWAVLKPLCQEVGRLPDAERASTWQAIVRLYLAVPPTQLAAALAQLHGEVRTLRNAAGAQRSGLPLTPTVLRELPNWQQQGGALAPEARHTVLLMGIQGLDEMPPAKRQRLFGLALRSIPALRQEHRGPMLAELAQAIAALPDAARRPEWQATLQAIGQWPPGERVHLFEPVAAQIGVLPLEARAAAFESLLQAHRGLPAQCHALSVVALGTGCVALPRAEWPHVLDQVLAEAARIPELEPRALGLLGLAGKFCLAGPAAIGPLDLPQPGGPRLDVRVRCLDTVVASLPLWRHPPAGFEGCVNALKDDVERRLQQRPDDAAVLTAVLERLRWLMCPLDTPRAGQG
jgi:hypothetical protein